MYVKQKRILDYLSALLLIAALSLLFGLISIFIAIEGRGPVLYRQERPGKNGEMFTIYKFRTMASETCRAGMMLSDKERTTRLGAFLRKTSLDELPQLFNIIKGEMSFVGPRPLLKEYLPLYSARQARRHEVLPGMTGFAQVNGRNTITWEQKFEYDVTYVETMNLLLDVKIIFKTIVNIIRREGVDSSKDLTMSLFTGIGS